MSATVPRRLASVTLIALMAAGSILLWVGLPLGWVLLASQVASPSQPTFTPLAIVLIGSPISMIIVARLLKRLDQIHEQITGAADKPARPHRMPWNRSLRDAREETHGRSVLDVVMVVSVGAACVAAGIWFVFFAGTNVPLQ